MDKITTTSVADFYELSGQSLLDANRFPSAIANHLEAEQEALAHLIQAHRYGTVIEAGCTDGTLHFKTIVDSGARYIGVDLIGHSIERLRWKIARLAPDSLKHEALVMDVCELTKLVEHLAGQKVLVMLPFNCFGNLPFPEKAVETIRTCGFDMLIFTYRTDVRSTMMRHEYYLNCHYKRLSMIQEERGVLFRSDEGLHSYAYDRVWLTDMLVSKSFRPYIREFGIMGVYFHSMNRSENAQSLPAGI